MGYFRVPNPHDEGLPEDVPEFTVEFQDDEIVVMTEVVFEGDDGAGEPVIAWMSPAAAMRLAARLMLAANSAPRWSEGGRS